MAFAAVLLSPQAQAQQAPAEKPQNMLSAQILYAGIHLRQVAWRHQGQEALPAGSRSLDPQMQQRHHRVSRAPDMAAKVEPLP